MLKFTLIISIFLFAFSLWSLWQLLRQRSAIRHLKEQLGASYKDQTLKSEFMANFSHEVKTPMNGIIGMVSVMQEMGLTPPQKHCLQTIGDCSRSLLDMLNNILDLSKLEAGRLELEHDPFQPQPILQAVADLMRGSAMQKNLILELNCDFPPSYTFHGDPLRLRQVLLNLVSNAIKFTETGTVSIHASIETNTAPNSVESLRIAISDTGPGIPLDQLESIFLPFYQVDSSYTRSHSGTGLGLTISRRLIHLMNGSLTVQTEPGNGSCFTVLIHNEPQQPHLPN